MSTERLSLTDAVARMHPVDSLGVPLGPGQPAAFMHALGERTDWEHLEIGGALLVDLYGVFLHPGVNYRSGFFGPAERFLRDSGARVEFVPADFRRFAPIAEQMHSRVVATIATPPDKDGYCSLGLHAGATISELRRAGEDPDRVLLVETNAALPYTFGLPPEHAHRLHIDEIDIMVESDRPIFELPDAPPNDVERAIAAHAATFIVDGATLQTGIGGIPSQVATILAEGPGGDYGVHSEMFTNGLMRLHLAGKVTNARKDLFDGMSITTFAAGSRDLYDWLDHNDEVRFLPVDMVNAPETISKNHLMVSINGALAVDLYGQVMADTLSGSQFSGIGGHEDFVASSGLELEDRSLICLPSSSTVEGVRVPRIVDFLPHGAIVTTPRHHIDLVVTEFGSAHLRGRTVRERAFALAEIAHPDDRDHLRESAQRL
ncbi:MAG: acetyl-CoA hydrolase/transferase C-terminal domain-containing protein [Acidimicrobiia bacterium]